MRLVRASKLAALFATHNHELAQRMDRRITLRDGKVVEVDGNFEPIVAAMPAGDALGDRGGER